MITAPSGIGFGQCHRLAQAQACSSTPLSKVLFVPFFPQLRPLPLGLSPQAHLLELRAGEKKLVGEGKTDDQNKVSCSPRAGALLGLLEPGEP